MVEGRRVEPRYHSGGDFIAANLIFGLCVQREGWLAGRFNCTQASQAQPPSVFLFQKRSLHVA